MRLYNLDPNVFDETRIWDGDAWVRLDSDTGDLPEGEWTSSAAAIRYWFLTKLRGVPHTAIDRNSVVEAGRICSERSYAVNGVIADDEDVNEIEDLFDFAWQGQVIDAGGVLLFRPGADRDPVLTLDVDDEAVSIDAVKPAPSLSERVNELTLTLDQSDAHQFRPMAMPPVVDRETQDRDGRRLAKDLGNIRLVTHAPTANRLMAIALKRARANTRFAYTLPPGDDYRWLTIRSTDRIRINDSENGLSAFLAEVLTFTVNEDWSVSIELQAAPDGIYDDDAAFPPLILPAIDVADPTDVATPTGGTATAFDEKNPDGTTISGFEVTWDDTATPGTDLRYRKAGNTQWIFANSPASPIRVVPLLAGDFEYQLRHVSSKNIASEWTPTATVTIERDQIPPANPRNFAVAAIAGGYQATWTASPDTDYHHTQVYDAPTGTAFTDATLRTTTAGLLFERHSLTTDTLDVWIRHVDTWGNASGEASATVTPSAQGQGIPGASVAELIVFRTATAVAAALGLIRTPTATNYDFSTSTFTELTSGWALQWPAHDPQSEYVYASTVVAVATAGGTDTSLTFSAARLVLNAVNIDVIYKRSSTPPAKPANQAADRNPTDYPAPDTGWSTDPPTGDDPLYSSVRAIRGTQWVHDTPVPVAGPPGLSGKSPQEFYRWSLLDSPPSTPTYPENTDARVNDDFVPSDWVASFNSIPRIKPAPAAGPVVIWRAARSWNSDTGQWSDFTPPVVLGSTGDDLRGEPGAGFNWRGPWASTTAYVLQDVVNFGGRSFICVEAHTASTSPSISVFVNPDGSVIVEAQAPWQLVANRGAQGEASTVPGPRGQRGPASTVVGPQGDGGRSAQEYFRITRLNDRPSRPTGWNAQDGSPPNWTTAAGLPRIRPVPIPGNPLVLWRISRTWNEGTDQWNDFTPPALFDAVPGADGEGEDGDDGRSAQEYFRITRLNDPPPKPTGRNAQDGSPPDWTTAAGLPRIRPVPIPGNPLVLWRISRTWNEGTDQWNDFTPPVLFDAVPGADGEGVPGGGTLGQVLTKIAEGDFQTGWQDASDGSTVPGPQGPQGAQGEVSTVPGPRGLRGLRGLDSTVPGPRGLRGLQGAQGDDSTVPGPRGLRGLQGAQGDDSTAPGPRGLRGLQGAQGDDSTVPGPRGRQGQRGFRGIVGAVGAVGAQGAQGSQGAQGAQGPSHSHGTIFSRLSSLENEVDDHDERIIDLESA